MRLGSGCRLPHERILDSRALDNLAMLPGAPGLGPETWDSMTSRPQTFHLAKGLTPRMYTAHRLSASRRPPQPWSIADAGEWDDLVEEASLRG